MKMILNIFPIDLNKFQLTVFCWNHVHFFGEEECLLLLLGMEML